MTGRRYLFPNVIELNRQAGHRIGVNVYLVEDAGEFVLIDVGYEDAVEEIVDLVRQMDFPMSACKLLVATHADVDHSQGLAKAKEIFNWETTQKFLRDRGVTLLSAGLDEVPMAYKDIDEVMAAQGDLVETLARFEPRLVKMAPSGEPPED